MALRTRIAIMLGVGFAAGAAGYLAIQYNEAVVRWQITCVGNLRRIAGAKATMAQEQGLTNGTIVSDEKIAQYLELGWPACPAGGKYTANAIGNKPTCSIPNHSLSP